MTHRITFEQLVAIVEGDRELVTSLIEHAVIVADSAGSYGAVDVDRVLVSRTLVRELEVNFAGVEIILRMREQLARTRRQLRSDSHVDPDDG